MNSIMSSSCSSVYMAWLVGTCFFYKVETGWELHSLVMVASTVLGGGWIKLQFFVCFIFTGTARGGLNCFLFTVLMLDFVYVFWDP